jgi:NAD(P)H-nitrite reductase large subunit
VELRCDFCGELVPRVRRIALDHGYERLRTPHQVRYACSACSDEKERQRIGS